MRARAARRALGTDALTCADRFYGHHLCRTSRYISLRSEFGQGASAARSCSLPRPECPCRTRRFGGRVGLGVSQKLSFEARRAEWPDGYASLPFLAKELLIFAVVRS